METPTAAKAQASDPPARRIRTDDAKSINDARTLLGLVKNVNKDASIQSREDASVALDMLTTFTKADKSQFAKKVLDSKKKQRLCMGEAVQGDHDHQNKAQEGAKENYYTRTGCNRQAQ